MSVPPDQMNGSQLDMLAQALRKQFSPTWDASSMGGQNQQQNQTSQTGGMNGLTSLAKALILRKPGVPGPTTASSIQSMGAPDTSNLYGLSGIGQDLGASAGTPAGSSGLLPGSIAGADMSDTAAYSPAAIDATSGSGLASTAAGLAGGLGAFGAGYGLSRALAGTGNLNSKDMNRNLAGEIATNQQKVAQLQAQGDTQGAAQLQNQIDSMYVQDAQYRKSLGLAPLVNPNTTKDAHGLLWDQQYIADHSGSGGPRKIL